MSKQEQIDKLHHDQNKDRYMERLTSKDKDEIAILAPGGIPSVPQGSIFGDGVPHIDERFQEDRKAQREDSRTTEFRRMCPDRSFPTIPGHGEWEAFLARKMELEDILERTPKPRTQMQTLEKFVRIMESDLAKRQKQIVVLHNARPKMVRKLIRWAKKELATLSEWADSIEARENLAVEKARAKIKRSQETSITRKQLTAANVEKARVKRIREALAEPPVIGEKWKQDLETLMISVSEGQVPAPKSKKAKSKKKKKSKLRKENPDR